MKIRGVLLGTLKEQVAGGDPNPIDPKLVKLDRVEDGIVPVTIGFQRYRVVCKTTRAWLEDGRILFEAEVDEMQDFTMKRAPIMGDIIANKSAIGIFTTDDMPVTAELAYELEMKDFSGRTIKGGKLFEVGLTDENENCNQPPFEVIEP